MFTQKISDKIGLIVHKYNLVITNKAVLKESCVVKSVALDYESSWVARVAQGHQHLKMMTMMIQLRNITLLASSMAPW